VPKPIVAVVSQTAPDRTGPARFDPIGNDRLRALLHHEIDTCDRHPVLAQALHTLRFLKKEDRRRRKARPRMITMR